MQQSIVKFIAWLYRHCSTCFGHYNAHYQEPRTLPPPHSYGNHRLQRQFDGLLMMGIVMPETCWAVSVWKSNKFYDWLLHLVGCFIWVLDEYRYGDCSSASIWILVGTYLILSLLYIKLISSLFKNDILHFPWSRYTQSSLPSITCTS